MKNIPFSIFIYFLSLCATAQNIVMRDTTSYRQPQNLLFNCNQLIIPTVLIGYGIVGLGSGQLIDVNNRLKNEVVKYGEKKITIDDFSQYAPAVSVYILNNLGIKGKNTLRDRSIILAASIVLVFTAVKGLKQITKIERPDGTPFSFPSGHTAVAFAGAEFLYQEYKDISIWYGLSGYMVATATGGLRIYNNRHWLNDVVAGAGFGILSTKAAYWLFPYLKEKISISKSTNTTTLLMPYYDGKQMGCHVTLNF